MASVLSLQPAQALPSSSHENATPYVNGHIQDDSPPGPSHRSTYSASSGEGLSMRDTGSSRTSNHMNARSQTEIETNGPLTLRQKAAKRLTNGDTLPSRPKGQLQRANTDHGPRARSPQRDNQSTEENWEMRHGWEDEQSSSELLARLSTVGALKACLEECSADSDATDLLHVLYRQAS